MLALLRLKRDYCRTSNVMRLNFQILFVELTQKSLNVTKPRLRSRRLSSMIGTSQFTLQEMRRQGLTDQQINTAFNDMIRQQTNELDSIERAPNIAHQVELHKIHAVAKSIHDFIDANSELYTAGLHFKTSWNAARANELLKALTPVGAVASRGSSLS
ncbi:hypothetical protein C8R42DRAFT_38826 [Lentinula raphanica]|nr:hypothetical protein C8R42DRAFT_38826 [Lentinula raphanica]